MSFDKACRCLRRLLEHLMSVSLLSSPIIPHICVSAQNVIMHVLENSPEEKRTHITKALLSVLCTLDYAQFSREFRGDFFTQIWTFTKKLLEKQLVEEAVNITCLLVQVYTDVAREEEYWFIVYSAFGHSDPLVCKRGRYLLSMIVNTFAEIKAERLSNQDLSAESLSRDLNKTNYQESIRDRDQWMISVESMQSDKWAATWSVFLTLFDTLQEWAVHLIESVWPQLHTLRVEGDEADAFFSSSALPKPLLCFPKHWMQILFMRGLQHANNAVQRITLRTLFLEMQNRVSAMLFDDFICNFLIASLNNINLFYNPGSSIDDSKPIENAVVDQDTEQRYKSRLWLKNGFSLFIQNYFDDLPLQCKYLSNSNPFFKKLLEWFDFVTMMNSSSSFFFLSF